MDRISEYRSIMQQVLQDYYQLYQRSDNPNFETMLLCDESQDHCLLIRLGWEGDRRINHTVIHLRLRDEKIWVEEDSTEAGVSTDLLAAGIPHEAIVLGFHPPRLRQYTEFAIV